MGLKEVSSHKEMLGKLKSAQKNYVLLYKKGSENSHCSYNSIEQALDEVKGVNLLAVEVGAVKDIHPVYEVSSVPTLLVFEGNQFVKTVKGCNDEGFYKNLFESSFPAPKSSAEDKPRKRVTVYSTPSCSWCTTLKTHLKKNGIVYTEIDVSKDQRAAEAMVRKSGQQGVPQTDINGEMIIGFDKSRINTLLNIN